LDEKVLYENVEVVVCDENEKGTTYDERNIFGASDGPILTSTQAHDALMIFHAAF